MSRSFDPSRVLHICALLTLSPQEIQNLLVAFHLLENLSPLDPQTCRQESVVVCVHKSLPSGYDWRGASLTRLWALLIFMRGEREGGKGGRYWRKKARREGGIMKTEGGAIVGYLNVGSHRFAQKKAGQTVATFLEAPVRKCRLVSSLSRRRVEAAEGGGGGGRGLIAR